MRVYKKDKQERVLDQSRNVLVPNTPEEQVRQNIVSMLVQDMNIPIQAIDTEYALNKWDSLSKLRADIVVWHHDDATDREVPLLVIEVKAQHVPITDRILEQALAYQSILKSKYVAVSNGAYLDMYCVQEDGSSLLLSGDIHSYSNLIQGDVQFSGKQEMNRLKYEETSHKRYIDMLIDRGYIGEDTSEVIRPFLSELHNFLLVEPISNSLLLISYSGFQLVQDLGWSIQSYGNAAGGSFPGYYRGFVVKNRTGNEVIYRVGMFGTAKLKNDPVFGNRKGYTSINVATEDVRGHHNSLQLNADMSIRKGISNSFDIFHSGRLTMGKKGSLKTQIVKDYVQKEAPELMIDEEIYLGNLPDYRSISWKEGEIFIMNLLVYANLRDEIRNIYTSN
ncbi:type I restriction enzyme HsdR N-terminal domain-containing protein [Priestia megaterium]|uniref:type I restriction enzyme HsdR N-terminal domain-containing protein n=1 Tax=Priestia megaterium TaxID=1404 RepID=UPI002E1CD008|nr:type I restriction enzyme HsdR N-terminal domain-containing protein [Priestia megaterium]